MVGMVISIRGDCDGRPYLASSQARSMYSTLGQMCMVARCCGPGAPGRALNSGKPFSARFILSDVPSVRNLRMPSTKSGGRSRRVQQSQKRPVADRDCWPPTRAAISSPLASTTPRRAASAHQDLLDRGVGADHRAAGCAPNPRWRSTPRPCRRARSPTVRDGRSRRPCSGAAGCKPCRASAGRRWRRSRRRWPA